jgi:hypothetical protein
MTRSFWGLVDPVGADFEGPEEDAATELCSRTRLVSLPECVAAVERLIEHAARMTRQYRRHEQRGTWRPGPAQPGVPMVSGKWARNH